MLLFALLLSVGAPGDEGVINELKNAKTTDRALQVLRDYSGPVPQADNFVLDPNVHLNYRVTEFVNRQHLRDIQALSAPSAEAILWSLGFLSEDIQNAYEAMENRTLAEKYPRASFALSTAAFIAPGLIFVFEPILLSYFPLPPALTSLVGFVGVAAGVALTYFSLRERQDEGYPPFDFHADWAINHQINKTSVCVKYIQALTMAASKGI